MSNNLDLNRLRDTVLQNQNNDMTKPSQSVNKVFVDNEGKIHQGSEHNSNSAMSEVPQDTFANHSSRLETENWVINNYMPDNTQRLTSEEGVEGILYSFNCEYGNKYTMYAYYDGCHYQVAVLEPKVEEHWRSPHTGHIYSDGLICFGDDYNRGGRPSLQDAYSKSVLWATGLSVALETGHFPFSANQ